MQSLSIAIWEPKKIKSLFPLFPICCARRRCRRCAMRPSIAGATCGATVRGWAGYAGCVRWQYACCIDINGSEHMQLDLSGRHALVCGASQGIGRACAVELALLGASVTALARRGEVLASLVDSLPCTHDAQRHGFVVADAGDTQALRAQVEALVATAPVQILVNNSGGPPPSTPCAITPG